MTSSADTATGTADTTTVTSPPSTARKRKKTSTSEFGVSGREGHDASAFYARFEPPVLSTDETINPVPVDALGFHVGDSRHMDSVPDNSVALVVTSPPYYAGKAYEVEIGQGGIPGDYIEYLKMLHDVFAETHRVLEPGGRAAINVANLGRKPFRSLTKDVWVILEQLGFLPRGEIVWIKADGASGNAAFGSWMSPSNPSLRDLTERILIVSKGRFDRAVHWKKRQERELPWEKTIERDEFLAGTLDTWRMQPASATRIGHPAPFPIDLPRRCIELHTYKDDVVLDPFMGSGTTAIAATMTGRRFIGFDTDAAYVDLATQRLHDAVNPAAPAKRVSKSTKKAPAKTSSKKAPPRKSSAA